MKKVLTVFLVFLMVGCLAIPCFAAEDNEFTPSISGMVAPVLRPVGGSSATDGVAEIWYVDDEDHILEIVIPRSYISITPYADADKVGGKIGEDLKKAYAEIVDAECLGELHNGLDALVKEMYPTASCDDLIATDLFDMTLVHDPHHERVQDGEAYLRVRFDIGKTAGEPNPIVLHRPSDEIGWMVVDPDRVIDMGDGTVRVDFETLCPIAFLAVRADAAIPAPTPESCGCPDWCFLCPYLCFEHFCACILAYIVIALILLVIIISIICAIAGAARSQGHVCAPSLWQKVIARCTHLRPDLEAYDRNRKALYEGLTAMGYEMAKPDGAFYLFIKAPGGDDWAFSERAKEKDLLLVPGDGFGCPGYFRICYCVSYDMIQRSLPVFEALIKE